jgi:hypothetical protein
MQVMLQTRGQTSTSSLLWNLKYLSTTVPVFIPGNMFLFQAYDQPDVYETADLPESDQNTGFYEVTSIV